MLRQTGKVTALPLVPPGPPLTTAQVERYSRHLLLPGVGDDGQRRLANARVAVLGAGGLGSPVLTYLAAAGVGSIGVIDDDVVDMSNLQRQTVHRTADVGLLKTGSASRAIAQSNPLVTVIEHPVRLTSANALQVLGDYDLVVDGTDNFATRYLVSDACALLGVPCVWGSVFQFMGQLSVFWAGHGPTYRDVYPDPPPLGSVPSCGEAGVFGTVCAVIGSAMATEVIKLICGVGEPLLGRLTIYDALVGSYRSVAVRPDPEAPPVTELVDYEAFCGARPARDPSSDPELADRGVSTIDAHPGVLTPQQVSGLLQAGGSITVVDVREPAEFRLGALPHAILVPVGDIVSGDALAGLTEAAGRGDIVLYCKTGVRSQRAAEVLIAAGLTGVRHLAGGVLAWGREIDPTLPRY